ncbi:MAG: hypothetical protein A2Z81_03205 [Omnitrophica WOR_2 bacterium GWA2_45_18]|nr:MAG: hypothetical protein A2Z81_03205 [Omnitrophica WOR_2 bacterium GWA2_45_18]
MKSLIIVSLFVLFLSSCRPAQEKRKYEEVVVVPAPAPEMTATQDPHAFLKGPMEKTALEDMSSPEALRVVAASATKPDLSWETPSGWKETKEEGIRLVTFTSEGPKEGIECFVVSLLGDAGGLKANVIRWMGQIHMPPPAESDLNEFLASLAKTTAQSGWPVTIVDFTSLPSAQDPESPSMMAAIVEMQEDTIFVKMTGKLKAVRLNQAEFQLLCQSLTNQTK